MEPETNSKSFFSVKSPFHQETDNKLEALFKNDSWKQLSIFQGENLRIKLHADALEGDFPETFKIFALSKEIQEFLLENFNKNDEKLREEIRQKSEKNSQNLEKKMRVLEEKLKKEEENLLIKFQDLEEKNRILEEKNRILEEKLKKEEENRLTSEENIRTALISLNISSYIFTSETIQNGAFSLSISKTTVERINSTVWSGSGIRCDQNPFMRSSDKKTFSIRVEKTQNAYIMIGFCAKTADSAAEASGGYSGTKFSFMLYLYNGTFFSRGQNSDYTTTDLKQPAMSKQIFSSSLDIKKKKIKFYLNGKLLGPAKEIDLTPEEAEMMSPCVDLARKGDIVSLVYLERKRKKDLEV